jgi:hypothetical protein
MKNISARNEQFYLTLEILKRHSLSALRVHTWLDGGTCSCILFTNKVCKPEAKHPIENWKNGPNISEFRDFVIRSGKIEILANVGIRTGGNFVVIDCDSIEAYEKIIEHFPYLENTLTVNTAKGKHLYLRSTIEINNNTKKIKDIDIRGTGGYVVAPGSVHKSEHIYSWENPKAEILELSNEVFQYLFNSPVTNYEVTNSTSGTSIPEGERNNTLFKLTANALSSGLAPLITRQIIHQINVNNCVVPLDANEVDQICDSAEKKIALNNAPPIFFKEEYYGILGRITLKIAPLTEASPEAIYTQFLSVIGCFFGRAVKMEISGDSQYPNLFLLIVGDTALARKGTSSNIVREVLKKIIPNFVQNNFASGLSSGEGLGYKIRDAVYEVKQKKKKDGNVELISECIDQGRDDKRLCVIESEFGGALISSKREGNKLSVAIRDLFDSKDLGNLTISTKYNVTKPHVSITGHQTAEEFHKLTNSVDAFNGFLNRFLFCYSSSSKVLPFAPPLADMDLDNEINELKIAVERFVKKYTFNFSDIMSEDTRLDFSVECRDLYESYYRSYREGAQSGILGAMATRITTHVRKIALIFAVLDGDDEIKPQHLKAAIALGRYSEDSIKFIFKDQVTNNSKKSAKVLHYLKNIPNESATRTEISTNCLKGNSSKDEIDQIKNELVSNQQIVIQKVSGNEAWIKS